jgi:hypothetical protein
LAHVFPFSVNFFFCLCFYFTDESKKPVGKGGEGVVYLVKHKQTNHEYAIKEIFIKDPKDADKVKNPIEFIRKIPPSPHIVKYYEPLESAQNIYILMEFCKGGNLQEFIQSRIPDNELLENVSFFFFLFIQLYKYVRMSYASFTLFFFVLLLFMQQDLFTEILNLKTSSLMIKFLILLKIILISPF